MAFFCGISCTIVLLFSLSFDGVTCSDGLFKHKLTTMHLSLPSFTCTYAHVKYVGKKITYYQASSCTATFQAKLIECGDVHPNPGPQTNMDIQDSQGSIQSQSVVNSKRIRYDTNQLLSFRSRRFRVDPVVWLTLSNLGICKGRTKRVRKGGRCRRRRLQEQPCRSEEHSGDPVRFALWNARSLKNKTHMISDFISNDHIDIVTITETWLTGDDRDNYPLAQLTSALKDFDWHHKPRLDRVGGGVGLCIRKSFRVKIYEASPNFTSFEHLHVLLTAHQQVPTRVIIVYRPQRTATGDSTEQLFLREFSVLMEQLISTPHQLLIVGDFNYHVNSVSDVNSRNFLALLSAFNLQQHVSFPTHRAGHTLDLILTRASDSFVSDLGSTSSLPSDHVAITCSLNIRKPPPLKLEIKTRKIHAIDVEAFRSDILDSDLYTSPSQDLHERVDQFCTTLSSLLNHHAPEVTRTVTCRPDTPWYTDELRELKQKLRSLERKAASPHALEIVRQTYKKALHHYSNQLTSAKRTYHCSQLKGCSSRELFRKVDHLLRPQSSKTFPSNDGFKISLSERFLKYFTEKVQSITEELQSSVTGNVRKFPEEHATSSFSQFRSVTEDEVAKFISTSSSTTCELDPIPTSFMKKCICELLPIITQVINDSFMIGSFPEPFKHANIMPRLKSSTADVQSLKNYRPIANLMYFGKLLEKIAASQLQQYLSTHSLHARSQSGYRPFHSVETALLKVTNDILLSLDKGEEVILVLLDFSSAFDLIKHNILSSRLKSRFGINGQALKWIESYLSRRTHTVVIGNERSSKQVISQGVPQGSVLGPILFTLYTSPLENIIDKHTIHKMFYADDTQLYIAFKRNNIIDVTTEISNCVKTVKEWSRINGLKLNDIKTEFLHGSSRHRLTNPISTLDLDGTVVHASNMCKNLGVTFDDKFTFENFVSHKCRSASYGLYKIGKIRDFLDKATTERLIHAFVMCHFDFCNSLLFGLPSHQIQRLQLIQNSAARLVTRTKKHTSITPILMNLHWLPIQSRIQYKILLFAYQCFHQFGPAYLVDLLTKYKPERTLRSSNKSLFHVPQTTTRSYGERSFSYAAPVLWNKLPEHVRFIDSYEKFKISLKTHLFSTSYNL